MVIFAAMSIVLPPTILKVENSMEVGSEKPQQRPERSSPKAPLCWLPVLLHALIQIVFSMGFVVFLPGGGINVAQID